MSDQLHVRLGAGNAPNPAAAPVAAHEKSAVPRCAHCGVPLPEQWAQGRRRRFCSDSHRQAAMLRRVQGLPEATPRVSSGGRARLVVRWQRERDAWRDDSVKVAEAKRNIDRAVEACELLNLVDRRDLPRWIADLVVDLAAHLGADVAVPRTPVDAHDRLMNLAAELPRGRR